MSKRSFVLLGMGSIVWFACEANSLYCVIDLSAGPAAANYPVTELSDVPSGGWTDEYKTTKLVLRRIEAGTFKMQNQYDITLTKPFYIGVFEVTRKQYELVSGVEFSGADDMLPVIRNFYSIRGYMDGAKWPKQNSVDATSFLGKLRVRTGLDFDLPTEAQWEYACRAGTTSDYNNGGSKESDFLKVAYHASDDSPRTKKVGSYMPNAWGLYDMHGNVSEWCLDWYGPIDAATDPRGAEVGMLRVFRGGNGWSSASRCTSSFRNGENPAADTYSWATGFRLSWTLYGQDGPTPYEVPVEASSERVSVDTTFIDGTLLTDQSELSFGLIGGLASCEVFVDDKIVTSETTSGTVKNTLEFCSARTVKAVFKMLNKDGDAEVLETSYFSAEPTVDHVLTTTKAAVEPTSGATGMTAEIRCSRCGEIFQEAVVIPALGYVRNMTARQLWPHKKIEVCYELAGDIGEVVSMDSVASLSCDAGDAVSYSEPELVLGSPYSWRKDTTTCRDGESSWRSGNYNVKNSRSIMSCTVSKAKNVSFYWKVSSESGCDKLRFYVDDSDAVAAISGTVGWTFVSVDLDASKTHSLKWSYEKDGSVDKNDDRGWVDCITVAHEGFSATAQTVLGDVGLAAGAHRLVWDFERDGIEIDSGNQFFTAAYSALANGRSSATAINTSCSVKDEMEVAGSMELGYSPIDARSVELQIDGTPILSSEHSGTFLWQPLTLGSHTLTHIAGDNVWTRTVNVTSLAFATMPVPDPQTVEDPNIMIRQASHSFVATGGAYSIPTAGVSGYVGSFSVSKSEDWIMINSAEANWIAGRAIVYTVSANDSVEERTGYVYVGGHVHTITQEGVGAELSVYSADFGVEGGEGCVTVLADSGIDWHARPNADWISVASTSGSGEGSVSYTVAPWNEVSIRTATITVAGRTFTVTQTGRSMELDKKSLSLDYNAQAVELAVSALPSVRWDVEPNAPWISVSDTGTGEGGAAVTLTAEENLSYSSRKGLVRIGTETVTISQEGRPTAALAFTIDPVQTTASETETTGGVAVIATPGLPWSAQSKASWIVITPSSASGMGDGSFTYSVAPNPTMSERSGMITATPEAASGLGAKSLVVVQSAAKTSISVGAHEFAAKGETFEIAVSTLDVVEWGIVSEADWVTIEGPADRTGPGPVRVIVDENTTLEARGTTIMVAGHEFKITQHGRTVEVDPPVVSMPMDGGLGVIKVIADAYVRWNASPSDVWISIWGDDSCDYDADGNVVDVGSGAVNYYIDGCEEGALPRTGWIQIGDKRVNILQSRDGIFITVVDDPAAIVDGDAETGFVVKPSEGKSAVEVTIPQGVDAAKVTVEVSPKVASVKPNGAKVKIVNAGADITEFLNVPAADGNGVVDLTKATVKEEIVKEAMDVEKGAKIELNSVNPTLITPNTRVGLFYQLREGTTLEGMSNGDSTIGDGNPWKPEIKVKGGNSAFYSIGVGKGE